MAPQLIDRIAGFVLDESKWLFTALLLSVLAVLVLIDRRSWRKGPLRPTILRAMHLFYGCTIAVMAFGHLLAVSVEWARGTLEGSPWFLLPLGLVLFVPSAWLMFRFARPTPDVDRGRSTTAALDVGLGLALLALGPHNAPLAAPAALNLAYLFHSRRAVGWTIVSVTVAADAALFVGSLVFLASGQSFEQFKGM